MRWLRIMLVSVFLALATQAGASAQDKGRILIVMDERPQMESLAAYLKQHGGLDAEIVDQASLPESWGGYGAVIGYVHGALREAAELKFIEYTKSGGRLVLLHHTISSGKARNKYLFDFLGIALSEPEKAREPSTPGGHYAWRDPVEQVLVNLQPSHYITGNGISWPAQVNYSSSDHPSLEREYPGAVLKDSEVYVNHKFTDGREKTVLLGFKWTDERNGQSYAQDRSGWYRRRGKGTIFYFQPGHSTQELLNPVVARMILNAILWQAPPD